MSVEKVVNAVDIATDKLPYMESPYKQVKDEVEKLLQYIRQRLEYYIEDLKYKISILDINSVLLLTGVLEKTSTITGA